MSPAGRVVGLGGEGEGVLREGGKVVFVPGALPGERIVWQAAETGRRFDRGVLVEILEAAPERRPSPCAHDHRGGCGGCGLLHARPAAAAAMKAAAFRELLSRAGVPTETVEPVRLAGSGLGYRNHARFFVVGAGRLAYVARQDPGGPKARVRIEIDACPVLDPRVEALRAALDGRSAGVREVEIRVGSSTGERLVLFHGDRCPAGVDPVRLDAAVALVAPEGFVPLRGLPQHHEIVAGVRFRVSAGAFFQVNTAGAEALVGLVAEMAGPLGPKSFAADLYAGVGLFSLTALRGAGRLLSVESSAPSLRDLRENSAGRAAHAIRAGAVEEALEDLLEVRDVPDVAVLDPPRAGLGPTVTRLLARLAPPRLILVSCDPQSLGRDLPALLAAGWICRRAVPVDQFGGTPHLESVLLLTR